MNNLARLNRWIIWIAIIVFAVVIVCFMPAGSNERMDVQEFSASRQLGDVQAAMLAYTDGGPIPKDLSFVAKVYDPASPQVKDILQGQEFTLNPAVVGRPMRDVPESWWLVEKREGQRRWRIFRNGRIEASRLNAAEK
jgi:hypothetical protein